jgi:hypothetical protein
VPDVIVVAGVTNLQFSVPVGGFPVAYAPVWYPQGQTGVRVAGVGYNVAAGLAALGGEVRLATFAGGNLLGSSDAVRVAPPGILGNWGLGDRAANVPLCPRAVLILAWSRFAACCLFQGRVPLTGAA